jgi:hypothetical protein
MVLSVIAILFWLKEDENPVTVTYNGVSANDSNRVMFAITNASEKTFVWLPQVQQREFESWRGTNAPDRGPVRIAGQTATTLEVPMRFTKVPWRIEVAYYATDSDSWIRRNRKTLSRKAKAKNWTFVSELLWPTFRFKFAYGPEMLGHKPVAPSSVGAKSL